MYAHAPLRHAIKPRTGKGRLPGAVGDIMTRKEGRIARGSFILVPLYCTAGDSELRGLVAGPGNGFEPFLSSSGAWISCWTLRMREGTGCGLSWKDAENTARLGELRHEWGEWGPTLDLCALLLRFFRLHSASFGRLRNYLPPPRGPYLSGGGGSCLLIISAHGRAPL